MGRVSRTSLLDAFHSPANGTFEAGNAFEFFRQTFPKSISTLRMFEQVERVEPAWRWRCSCSTRTRTTRPGRAPGALFHVQTSLRKAGASKECDSGRVRHFSPAGQPPSSVRTTPHRSPARLTACKCTPSHQRFHPVDILSHIAMQKIAIPMKNNPCEAPMLPKPRYPYPYPNPDPNPNPNPDPDPDPNPNPIRIPSPSLP